MAQEDKELLLKDLCGRLPHKVKVHLSRKHNRPEEDIVLNNIIVGKDGFVTSNIIGYNYLLSEIKPYLRPMSSMTEEEKIEYQLLCDYYMDDKEEKHYFNNIATIDWYHQKHFDCRGLIKLGLALEAPEGMYK